MRQQGRWCGPHIIPCDRYPPQEPSPVGWRTRLPPVKLPRDFSPHRAKGAAHIVTRHLRTLCQAWQSVQTFTLLSSKPQARMARRHSDATEKVMILAVSTVAL